MISVCMAVYNGSKYLNIQLLSILNQLGADDELIIVDDCSVDDSSDIVFSIGDSRIIYHKNDSNVGVLKSFEKSLRLSKGSIIFLSDQDDIWCSNKVSKIINLFYSEPAITLIATDAAVIDDTGNITSNSYIGERGGFHSGAISTISKNTYLGCTLSFRRSMLDRFLPIPRDVPMHDIWFGLVNSIFGVTRYIDEPLILYRRHSANTTSLKPTAFSLKLLWRVRLLKNISIQLAYYYIFKLFR